MDKEIFMFIRQILMIETPMSHIIIYWCVNKT